MLVPILLGWPQANHADHQGHISHESNLQIDSFNNPLLWLAAVIVHSAGHLLIATLIALVVYEKLGLALLRRAWFNLDLLWMIALILSGLLILII